MTEEQRAELEKLARAAHDHYEIDAARARVIPGREKNAIAYKNAVAAHYSRQLSFQAAANPATVLDLLATIARLEAEKVKDGEALEPFARAAGKLDGKWDDRDCRWNCPTRSGVTVAHIRAASARLSSRAKDQSQ